MDVFKDVDDKLFAFETLFTEVLHDHASLKQFHVRGNQVLTWQKNGAKRYAIEIGFEKSLQKTELK